MSDRYLTRGFAPIVAIAILAIITSSLVTGVLVVQQKQFFQEKAALEIGGGGEIEDSDLGSAGGEAGQETGKTESGGGSEGPQTAEEVSGGTPLDTVPPPVENPDYSQLSGIQNPWEQTIPGSEQTYEERGRGGTGGTEETGGNTGSTSSSKTPCQECQSAGNTAAECASVCNITYPGQNATPAPWVGGQASGGGSSGFGRLCNEGATETNNSGGVNYCSRGNWYSCPAGQTYQNGQCENSREQGSGTPCYSCLNGLCVSNGSPCEAGLNECSGVGDTKCLPYGQPTIPPKSVSPSPTPTPIPTPKVTSEKCGYYDCGDSCIQLGGSCVGTKTQAANDCYCLTPAAPATPTPPSVSPVLVSQPIGSGAVILGFLCNILFFKDAPFCQNPLAPVSSSPSQNNTGCWERCLAGSTDSERINSCLKECQIIPPSPQGAKCLFGQVASISFPPLTACGANEKCVEDSGGAHCAPNSQKKSCLNSCENNRNNANSYVQCILGCNGNSTKLIVPTPTPQLPTSPAQPINNTGSTSPSSARKSFQPPPVPPVDLFKPLTIYIQSKSHSPYADIGIDLSQFGTKAGIADVGLETIDNLTDDFKTKQVLVRTSASAQHFEDFKKEYAKTRQLVRYAKSKGIKIAVTIVSSEPPTLAEWEQFLQENLIDAPAEEVPDILIPWNELGEAGEEGSSTGIYLNRDWNWITDEFPKYLAAANNSIKQSGKPVEFVAPSLGWQFYAKGPGLIGYLASLKKVGLPLDKITYDVHGQFGIEPYGSGVVEMVRQYKDVLYNDMGVVNPQIQIGELWFGPKLEYGPIVMRDIWYLTNQYDIKRVFIYPSAGWKFGCKHEGEVLDWDKTCGN